MIHKSILFIVEIDIFIFNVKFFLMRGLIANMIVRILLLFVMLISAVLMATAQDLRNHSEHYLLFKHDLSSFEKLVKKPSLIHLNEYQTNRIGFVHRDSLDTYIKQQLQPGQYTVLSVNKQLLTVEYLVHSGLLIALQSFGNKPGLRIWNKDGFTVNDALVKHKRRKLKLDEETKAYMFKSFIQSGSISVEKNVVKEKFILNYKMPPWSSGSGYASFPCYDVGFAVASQPVYRHGDTLKIKAYLSDCDGKPLSNGAIIKVEFDYKKLLWQDTIMPVSDGAYVIEKLLTDSLKLDKTYTVNFIPLDNKGKDSYSYKQQKNVRFKLEDYELKEATLSIVPVRTLYHREQPIDLRFEAKDKNGQPLMDATAEIIITAGSVDKIYERKIIVPDTLFIHNYSMDETGVILITIPDSAVRLPANHRINIKTYLRNSSNETVEKSFSLQLQHQKLEFKMDVFNDTVFLNSLNGYEGLVVIKQFGSLKEELDSVRLPAKIKLNASTETYTFKSENQVERLNLSSINNGVKIHSETKRDTIEIRIEKPFNIEISAFTRHRGERTFLNTDSADTYKFQIKSHEKISVYVQYLWAGKAQQGVSDYQLFEKKLFIETNLPEITFPGKNETVEIKVKDYLDIPIANANLTVLSYNNQFKESFLPQIPNYGFQATPTKIPNNQSLSTFAYSSKNLLINQYWAHEFGLQHSAYYRALLVGNRGFNYSLPLGEDDYPQLAIYAVKDKKFIEPAYVEIDGMPAWYHKAVTPYSLIATEGYHKVRLRFRDFELSIDSVCAEWERKTIIAINLDSLPSYATIKSCDKFLSPKEVNNIKKYFVPLRSENNTGKTLVTSNRRFYFFNNNQVSSFWLGPLFPNDMKMFSSYKDSIEFGYEAGFNHHIKKNVVMLHEWNTPNTKELVYNNYNFWDIHLKERAFSIQDRSRYLKKPLYEIDKRNFTKPDYRTIDYSLGRIKVLTELKGAFATSLYSETDKLKNKIHEGSVTEFNNLPPGNYVVQYYFNEYTFMSQRIEVVNGATAFVKITRNDLTDSTYLKEVEEVFGIGSNHETTNNRQLYSISVSKNNILNGEIIGNVKDIDSNEPAIFASIVLLSGENVIAGTTTDMDGYYLFGSISPGVYDIQVRLLGYEAQTIKSIPVSSERIATVNVMLKQTTMSLGAVEIVEYRIPLIDKDDVSTKQTIRYEQIKSLPTRNVQSVASTTAGVYLEEQKMGALNIHGGREESTEYYIDGIRVRGSSDFPINAKDQQVITGGAAANYGDISGGTMFFNSQQDKYEALPMDASGIRSAFSDNAIWQPNLLSDSSGAVSFNVIWPDNITQWKTGIIAVNDNMQTGTEIIYTKAYKPVQAMLNLPRFMVAGDSTEVIAKVMNYTGFDYNMKALYESHITNTIDTNVRSSATFRFPFVASDEDSAKATFSITLPNGYKDGETRSVQVFKKGLMRHEGAFSYLLADTSFTIQPVSAQHTAELRIQNQVNDIIKSEVNYLRGYVHTCNEQMASRLKGLLTIKYLDDEDEWKKRDEREVRKLIRKLEDNQTHEGGWSWWAKNDMNPFITLQVGEALLLAREQDYTVKSLDKLQNAIEKLIEKTEVQDARLHLLCLAAQLKTKMLYEPHILRVEMDTALTSYQKILLLRIKQLSEIQHNPYECFLHIKTTLYGNMYVCEEKRHLYNNSLYATSLVYEILRDANMNKDTVALVLGYMFEKRPGNNYRNTIISARIVRLLFDESKKQTASKANVTVSSNEGSETVSEFPFVKTLAAGEAAKLKVQTNTPLFINWHQNFFDNNPIPKTQYFDVQSELTQQGKIVTELKAGYPAELKVTVQVKFHSEYMMLDIPVPAGCSVEKGSKGLFEVHREYFRDRVSIYFESLPEGIYTYTVQLTPRYNGIYTLNPAHIEHMYFPQFEGFNSTKRMLIK
jgi:alpha-2-macroglobulin